MVRRRIAFLAAVAALLVSATPALGSPPVPFDHDPEPLLMTPTSFDFGEVQVGTSVHLTADITNVSGVAILMNGAGGAVSAPFSAAQNCQGKTLEPGESCQMFFSFSPTAPGAAAAVSSINWSGQHQEFQLKGDGITPRIRVAQSVLSFGHIEVGESSPQQAVDITNVSQASFVVSMGGGAPGGDFSGVQNCQGKTLAVGESCQIIYTFSPDSFGPARATSTFSINGTIGEVRLNGFGYYETLPACTIIGTAGNDELTGTPGHDVICGLGGRDRIDGLGGNDVIIGGAGHDHIRGGAGSDLIYGGPGRDRVVGGAGPDVVDGGRGNDKLWGAKGHDELFGRAHDDELSGGPGNDVIYGGSGADTCDGGPGTDAIFGC